MLNILIEDHVTPEIQRQIREYDSPEILLAALGKRLETDLRKHFLDRNSEPNQRNWPKKNFWSRIASATALESVSGNEAVVAISDPAINQKVHGGTITPKRGKYLAIPARGEAYAAGSPRRFDFLQVIFGRGRRPVALAERPRTDIRWGGRNKKGQRRVTEGHTRPGGLVWYWLTKSVTQGPDRRALPEPGVIYAGISETIREFFGQLGHSA